MRRSTSLNRKIKSSKQFVCVKKKVDQKKIIEALLVSMEDEGPFEPFFSSFLWLVTFSLQKCLPFFHSEIKFENFGSN